MDKMLEVLKDGSIVIPKIVFKYYHRLNITEEELIILIYMMNIGEKFIYDPATFVDALQMDKFKVMNIINSMEEKKVITIDVIKNKNGKIEEYINLDIFYNKLLNMFVDKKDDTKEENDSSNLFNTFEEEFGRTLSPMEYSIINGWISDNFSEELILEALKEATYNNVSNLRYIDRILYEWRKKGLKNKNAVERERTNYRKKKISNLEVFDYDWLSDEQDN